MTPTRKTAAEVATELRVSPRLIQKLCATGALRVAKVGSVWRITTSAIDDYLDQEASRPSCPAISTRPQTAPITLGSRSGGATSTDRYARLIGVQPGSASKSCSKRRRTSASA
ncbi:helix-turn-helix domain-containing protein [Asaia prunellae]|uniref:helix-turn-helix domain-containing protein n=1 Tax=Asaia prunellae TaxID=610245 RepID=UPI00046FEFC5|nr:helix-turn-helix domain-containing protein [Asaia prunellae]